VNAWLPGALVLLHFVYSRAATILGFARVVLLHFCFFARCDDFGLARVVLLHFCFFARCDDFVKAGVVGQAGSLRPIVNRPNAANVQHSSFAACRYAGCLTGGRLSIGLPCCVQGTGRRVANPPQDAILPHGEQFLSPPTEKCARAASHLANSW
jgi:hypothetical protein